MADRKAEYDVIAEAYRNSKLPPFREFIERYTLFEVLGDIHGTQVLDLACGNGFYARFIKETGASAATGSDVSSEMIRLAEEAESNHPLGCKYVCEDVAAFEPQEAVDIVVAMYLLNYAKSATTLGGPADGLSVSTTTS